MHFRRIIDVNINRLDESLKLTEDIVRFLLSDLNLLSRTRRIRQDFLQFKRSLPIKNIIGARQSQRDPGRKAAFDSRTTKNSNTVILANLTRAKEASRTLEEVCRTLDFRTSRQMKQIRFKLYDLEKEIVSLIEKKFDPSLHVIMDEKYLNSSDVEKVTKILADNGATMIQLRIHSLTDRDFLRYARKIRRAISAQNVKFVINNRADIAVACDADGVHLGRDDLPIGEARKILGDMSIIGASARTVKDARKLEREGADYLGVGAIYATKTKEDARRCDLKVLRSICASVRIPVIGIGGVNAENYKTILRAGASGIAVASYVFEGDIRKRLRSLTRK